MECPFCQTYNPDSQKYCGSCGRVLEARCPQCQAVNPPDYQFCGSCGASIGAMGNLSIARSGLVTQVNPAALELLGCRENEVKGKSFSLFVERADLVIYFSHLNELQRSGKKQSFEILLKHKPEGSVHAVLHCRLGKSRPDGVDLIHIELSAIADNRTVATQPQPHLELLRLVFSITGDISTAGKKHLSHSVEDALKKICLFAEADSAAVWGINRLQKGFDLLYHWRSKEADDENKVLFKSMPLSNIKNVVLRLRQERTVIVHQMAELNGPEREELQVWHQGDYQALICHIIYFGRTPVGTIIVARNTATDPWPEDSVDLIRLFGDVVSSRLPYPKLDRRATDTRSAAPPRKQERAESSPSVTDNNNRASGIEQKDTENTSDDPFILPNTAKAMVVKKLSGNKADASLEHIAVVPRDDGLVLLACTKCGHRETSLDTTFDKLGNAVSVQCSCGNRFAAVIERRCGIRKRVQIAGYFSMSGELGPMDSENSDWGPMLMVDLSKHGLRFTTEKAHLIPPGSLLAVRFNLNNANQALIHKMVRVITVTGREVGCRFEGVDDYDITLGFYLM